MVVNSLDELPHVLTQCFTTRPFTLSVAVEGMRAGMFFMTVDRHTSSNYVPFSECVLTGSSKVFIQQF